MSDLFIGLMSGTSMDGVDGVLADFEADGVRGPGPRRGASFDAAARRADGAQHPGPDELHRAWLAGNA